MLRSCRFDSPLGCLCALADDDALRGLWFVGQRFFGAGVPLPPPSEPQGVLALLQGWLQRYWAGAQPDPRALPLAPRGTVFQERVWAALLAIPYGSTVSYGALAAQLGSSPRAVGGAVGRNPIAIVIPCHRVVGAQGAITGYAGGLERKRYLLQAESGQQPLLTAPLRH